MHILRCLQPPESIQNQRFFSRGIFGVLEHTLNHPFNITTKMVRYTGPNPQSNWPIASDLTFPSRPEAVGTGGWPPRAFRDCWLDDAPRKVAMLWLKTLVPQMDGWNFENESVGSPFYTLIFDPSHHVIAICFSKLDQDIKNKSPLTKALASYSYTVIKTTPHSEIKPWETIRNIIIFIDFTFHLGPQKPRFEWNMKPVHFPSGSAPAELPRSDHLASWASVRKFFWEAFRDTICWWKSLRNQRLFSRKVGSNKRSSRDKGWWKWLNSCFPLEWSWDNIIILRWLLRFILRYVFVMDNGMPLSMYILFDDLKCSEHLTSFNYERVYVGCISIRPHASGKWRLVRDPYYLSTNKMIDSMIDNHFTNVSRRCKRRSTTSFLLCSCHVTWPVGSERLS